MKSRNGAYSAIPWETEFVPLYWSCSGESPRVVIRLGINGCYDEAESLEHQRVGTENKVFGFSVSTF